MRLFFVILALAAAFIGTIFAFRAIQRIHDGQEFRYEMIACAICATLITFVLQQRDPKAPLPGELFASEERETPAGACLRPSGGFMMLISYPRQRRVP